MNNKKIIEIIITLFICSILFISVYIIKDKLFKSNDNKESNTVDTINTVIDTDDSDTKIDWDNYSDTNYTLTESINITNEGVYNLTGTIDDGLITINTSGNVKLILDNVSITNSSGPAILIKNASDVVIELKEGSTNYLEDGSSYSSNYLEDEVGVIISHDDLTLEGGGSLVIKANSGDGIISKDDLKIISGNYEIDAADDAIRGKDSVYIIDGSFNITALGDAIKATNDTDTEKGFILIENGTFTINAEQDGIQAETKLVINNGEFNITCGGGSKVTSTDSNWGMWGRSTNTSSSDSSAKGLKAGDNLVINNGTFTLNTNDDAIHSNNYVGIKNGTFTISSGDDGIHADSELIIDNGNITISKSYEGLEAAKVTINEGNISVTASDDGINVAGGNDSSALNRNGANNFSSNVSNILTINGGTVYVNSNGDGLDANGGIYINGGNILVDGPTNNGNGALDYDRECVITGGELIAGGASGMAQNVSTSSTINGVLIGFNLTYSSSDKITITDSNGNTIASYESSKQYSSLLVASSKLKKGETYTVLVNGTTYQQFTVSSTATTVGNISGNGGMQPGNMPNGENGGNRGRR